MSCSVPPTTLWDCLNPLSLFKHYFLNLISLIHKENSPLLILNELSSFTTPLWNVCRLSEPRQPRNQMIAGGVASSHLPLGIQKPVITWDSCLRLHQHRVKCCSLTLSPPNLAYLRGTHLPLLHGGLGVLLGIHTWAATRGLKTWVEIMACSHKLLTHSWSAQLLPPESPEDKNQLLLECNPRDSYYMKSNKGAISIALVSLIGKESHNQAKRTLKHGSTINKPTKKNTKTYRTPSLPWPFCIFNIKEHFRVDCPALYREEAKRLFVALHKIFVLPRLKFLYTN